MNAYKNIIYVFVIGFAILAQLTNPTLAHADGEPPPLPTELVTEVAPPELPIATEPPSLPEESATQVAPTELPIATETPADTDAFSAADSPIVVPVEPGESTTDSAEPVAADKPTLLEAVQDIPAETEVVVLNEASQVEPLATQAAADIIADSDPVWCPTGQNPTPGANGCTPSYATLGQLLTSEGSYINSRTVNGTIWISSGAINEAGAISIDGSTYSNWNNYALTLQGGWNNGTAGIIRGTSVFSVPISITNWNDNVVVKNITINGNGTAIGLTVTTTGNINLDKVITSGNSSRGTDLNGTGNVTISNSQFNQNYIGAIIRSNGNIKVDKSGFSRNDWDGLEIFVSNGLINNIELTNSTFSYNNRNYTDGYGAWLVADPGDIINVFGNAFINNNNGLVSPANVNGDILSTNIFDLNCIDVLSSNIFQNGNYCGAPLPPPDDKAAIAAISARGPGAFTLNCAGIDGFTVNLPNGDLVNIYCPVWGIAQIDRVDNTILPGDLPLGYTYASAFSLDILQNQKPIPVIIEGGYITASFVAQPLQSGNSYSILYWDNGNWIPLKDFLLDENGQPVVYDLNPGFPNDTRKILKGVNVVANRGLSRVEISTNFPGIFVLAQQ
jgi:hypothetical protein